MNIFMFNVEVALNVWSNKRVQLFCDNGAVLDALSFGIAREQILAMCARNVWWLTAIYNISIVVSQENHNDVAGLLSRWKTTPEDVSKLNQLVESPIWINTHFDLPLLNYDIYFCLFLFLLCCRS